MLRVLVADSDASCAAQLADMLNHLPLQNVEAQFTDNFETAERLIQEDTFDLFFFAYFLEKHPSLELILQARALKKAAPAILLVDANRHPSELAALHAGFYDTLEKTDINTYMLSKIIEYTLSVRDMKRQLRAFENQNFATLESVNVSVITLDSNFRILYANKKAVDLLLLSDGAYQFDNLFRYAKFIRDLPDNDLRDRFSDHMQSQLALELSEGVQLINVENQSFCVEVTLSPFVDDNKKLLGAILIINDVSNTQELSKKLIFQANHDELTGLSNRNLFLDRLKQSLSSGQRYNQKFSLLFVDLDGFKKINDTLGHNYGDILLQQVSDRLKSCIRESDSLSRLGGDEFTIILQQIDKPLQAARVADSIINELARPFNLMGVEASVGASIGIANFPEDGKDKETLLKNADAAMYYAKERGKNNYQFYTVSLNDKSLEKLRLSNDIRRAIELNEFELHYQPQYNIAKNTMVGVEALIRWYHPVIGFVPPGEFIPIAEESSRIKNIGTWVLEQTCRQIQIWKRHGIDTPPVAVNLSVKQIENKFIDDILVIFNEFDIQPREVELEITENIFARDTKQILDILFELKFQGFNLALDDFGTGYSSLSYLGKMPIDTIKIDQSFIRGLDDRSNQAIVKTIIAMGKELNKRVIAEGVQTASQRDFLLENECVFMQGFLFSKPIMPSKLTMLLKKGGFEGQSDLNVIPLISA